jgi:predicted enzyme related to lactoylglutathione lyase
MPNPVVSFEIRGPDTAALRRFYGGVFGWEMFEFSPAYAGVETSSHTHDEATGATTYTGEDAYMNDGVLIGSSGGQPGWKFPGEPRWRGFETGIAGGIALAGGPAVTFYIQVDDVEATLATVEQHGGSVVRRPEEVAPNVVIAAFRDPAGNEIGLSRGDK